MSAFRKGWYEHATFGFLFSPAFRFLVGSRSFGSVRKSANLTHGGMHSSRTRKDVLQQQGDNRVSYGSERPDASIGLHQLQVDYELRKCFDARLPESVSDDNWRLLLQMPPSDRMKHFYSLAEGPNRPTDLPQLSSAAFTKSVDDRVISHDESNVSVILPSTADRCESALCDNRLIASIRCGGPRLIFDLSLLKHLLPVDQISSIRQLCDCCLLNRQHKWPFRIYFSSVDTSAVYWQEWLRLTNNASGCVGPVSSSYSCANRFIDLDSRDYLKMFHRDRFVYLTGKARQVLKRFDSDRIYVIGAVAPNVAGKSAQIYERTMIDKIPARRLPFETFADGQGGVRNRSLAQVLGILLDVNLSDDWRYAFANNSWTFT